MIVPILSFNNVLSTVTMTIGLNTTLKAFIELFLRVNLIIAFLYIVSTAQNRRLYWFFLS